jgi:hypothetical protein
VSRPPFRPILVLATAFAVAALLITLLAGAVTASDGVTMSARALVGGHARVGTWMAIAVDLANDGPPVSGELRVAAGSSGRTRYAVAVDLPTQSQKRYIVHVQAPAFSGKLTVALVSGTQTVAERTVDVAIHDASQLLVGVVAERPQEVAASVHLLAGTGGVAPAILPLAPEDLPDRAQAWSAIDRLVWQDVDADRLSTEQLDALAGWVADGGRLVIVAGTHGPDSLTGLPDALLPYRPDMTLEVPASSLGALLGTVPADAQDVLALTGPESRGRVLARVGDRVIAAEATYGTGSVTLLGVDPTSGWLADFTGTDALWRRLLPARIPGASLATADDGQLLGAVAQLPALAIPPVGGLLLILGAYILLVGPVNYLVLRRLDRREWAWVTIPLLIVGFTVGAYAIGAAMRGSQVIVNEIAIVRGAGADERGSALVYAGIFSPDEASYQVRVPGGALVSSPINGDFMGGQQVGSTAMDILQGDPTLVRNLAVGYGGQRSIRIETQARLPSIGSDLRLSGGKVTGTITNRSERTLSGATLVLGGNVQSLGDLGPGESATVSLTLDAQPWGMALSDRVIGQAFVANASDQQRWTVRRALIDQLTYDPYAGYSGQLPADGPVLLSWDDLAVAGVEVDGLAPRVVDTVLYDQALPLAMSGDVVFQADLVRGTPVAVDASFFSKDPTTMGFGQGSLTMAYRPIAFEGQLQATRLVLSMNDSGVALPAEPPEVAPSGPAVSLAPCTAQPCAGVPNDFMPEVEILDLTTQTWMAMPHMTGGVAVSVEDPARYVDPDSGSVWIRFQNQRPDSIGFSFSCRIEGGLQ